MPRSIAALTLVVRDYDEAIAFFTDALRFIIIEDTPLEIDKRRVIVAPTGASLLLAKAVLDRLQHRRQQIPADCIDPLRSRRGVHSPRSHASNL